MPVLAATPSYPETALAGFERALEQEGSGDPEPWIVLPGQLGDPRPMRESSTARLMAAVLADAVQVYLKHRDGRTANGRILFLETKRWIDSADRSWLLSFENVCDVLGIDAGRLREALRTRTVPRLRLRASVGPGRLRLARRRSRRPCGVATRDARPHRG
jgi:hypothetical protein